MTTRERIDLVLKDRKIEKGKTRNVQPDPKLIDLLTRRLGDLEVL